MTNDWNKSHRKERFNPGWERTRREVLDYYGWRCQYPVIGDDGVLRPCGAHANEVDHIIRAEDGQPDDDSWDIFRFFVVPIILIRLVWSRLTRGEGRGLSVRRLVGTGIPRSVS